MRGRWARVRSVAGPAGLVALGMGLGSLPWPASRAQEGPQAQAVGAAEDPTKAADEAWKRAVAEWAGPDYEARVQVAELEIQLLQAQIEEKRIEIRRAAIQRRAGELKKTVAILEKLDQPIPVQFPDETPLEDVLKYIKAATAGPNDNGIPIYVDPHGLQRADKTLQSPVTLDLDGVPLRKTLGLLLKQLGLKYEVREGLMIITSGEPPAAPATR